MADLRIDTIYDGEDQITVANEELDLIVVRAEGIEWVMNWAQAESLFTGMKAFFLPGEVPANS